jgi:hypothetical protein
MGSSTVELTSAVIGHHDSGRTDVQSTLCVPNTHDALEAELFTPFLSDTFGIRPVHRLVEHRAKIISDGYRDIRTLLHTRPLPEGVIRGASCPAPLSNPEQELWLNRSYTGNGGRAAACHSTPDSPQH